MAASQAQGTESNLGAILEQVAKEKGIERKVLVETIEAAILKAAQSVFGPTRELEARFNEDVGHVDLFQTVVEAVTQPEREISLADVEKYSSRRCLWIRETRSWAWTSMRSRIRICTSTCRSTMRQTSRPVGARSAASSS